MQQAIRQYYHLEEIWGDKPVRLKLGAPKPMAPVAEKKTAVKTKTKSSSPKASPAKKVARKTPTRAAATTPSPAAPAKKSPSKKSIKATGRPKTKAA
jgi:ribosome-associated protein